MLGVPTAQAAPSSRRCPAGPAHHITAAARRITAARCAPSHSAPPTSTSSSVEHGSAGASAALQQHQLYTNRHVATEQELQTDDAHKQAVFAEVHQQEPCGTSLVASHPTTSAAPASQLATTAPSTSPHTLASVTPTSWPSELAMATASASSMMLSPASTSSPSEFDTVLPPRHEALLKDSEAPSELLAELSAVRAALDILVESSQARTFYSDFCALYSKILRRLYLRFMGHLQQKAPQALPSLDTCTSFVELLRHFNSASDSDKAALLSASDDFTSSFDPPLPARFFLEAKAAARLNDGRDDPLLSLVADAADRLIQYVERHKAEESVRRVYRISVAIARTAQMDGDAIEREDAQEMADWLADKYQ